jgi:hypothetical protein
MGNMQQESSFNPASWNSGEGAGGLLQWREDRLAALQNFAKQPKYAKFGNDWTNPSIQLDFIPYEMAHEEASAGRRFRGADNLGQANALLHRYIRYGDNTQPVRLANSQQFANIIPAGDSSEAPSQEPQGNELIQGSSLRPMDTVNDYMRSKNARVVEPASNLGERTFIIDDSMAPYNQAPAPGAPPARQGGFLGGLMGIKKLFPNGLTGLQGILSNPYWKPSGLSGLLTGTSPDAMNAAAKPTPQPVTLPWELNPFSTDPGATPTGDVNIVPTGDTTTQTVSDVPAATAEMARPPQERSGNQPLSPEEKATIEGVKIDEPAPADPFTTPLSPSEEQAFQAWKQKYAPSDSGDDYDLRGAFKAGLTPDAKTGHWPDTYKKPNHPTFSDQSIYAKDAPEKAGHWEGDTFVPPGQQAPAQDSGDFESALAKKYGWEKDTSQPASTYVPQIPDAAPNGELYSDFEKDYMREQALRGEGEYSEAAVRARADEARRQLDTVRSARQGFSMSSDEGQPLVNNAEPLSAADYAGNELIWGGGRQLAGAKNMLVGGDRDANLADYDARSRAYQALHPGAALLADTAGPIPGLMLGSEAAAATAARGLKTLGTAVPALARPAELVNKLFTLNPRLLEEKSMPSFVTTMAARGAAEGAEQAAFMTPHEGGDLGTNMALGAAVGAPGMVLVSPLMTGAGPALTATMPKGTQDFMKMARNVIPDDALPRPEQLIDSPKLFNIAQPLTAEANVPQSAAFSREAGSTLGLTPDKPPTAANIDEYLRTSVKPDYNNVYGKLASLPNFNLQGSMISAMNNTWNTIHNKVLTSDLPELQRILENVRNDITSSPLNGDTLQAVISNDSELGQFMQSSTGVTKKYAGQLLDSLRKSVSNAALNAKRPALADELDTLNLKYKNAMVLKDAVGNSPTGVVDPYNFSRAFDSVYDPSVPPNPQNKMTVLRGIAHFLPSLTASGSQYLARESAAPSLGAVSAGAMRPSGGAMTSGMAQATSFLTHYGPSAAATGGLVGSQFGWGLGGVAGVGAIGLAMAMDKIKKAGMKNLLLDPAYRDALVSGGATAIDSLKMPSALTMPEGAGRVFHVVPNTLLQSGNKQAPEYGYR